MRGLPRVRVEAGRSRLALLRPGPYICAEWEGGGLPSWLAREPDYRPRSADPGFLSAVDGYFAQLLARVERHLGPHGGPIVALQVENEFGALGEQAQDYPAHLAKRLGEYAPGVALFTCDQAEDAMLARGGLPGVLRTVDFDAGAGRALAELRRQQPAGPLMAGEFWVGWFDHWGGRHHLRPAEEAAAELETLLAAGASVNLYMLHGGTNFGFTSGANDKHRYTPTVTSYDYDSPLDEAGDPTPKFAALREVIARHLPPADAAELLAEPIPPRAPKLAVPGIRLTPYASVLDYADALDTAEPAEQPPTMEQLGQDFGFVHYRRPRRSAAGTSAARLRGPRAGLPGPPARRHRRARAPHQRGRAGGSPAGRGAGDPGGEPGPGELRARADRSQGPDRTGDARRRAGHRLDERVADP
ncbi:MAG TPA: beta-galactosidase [Actinocrinis sp.]|nr:beta-galactosidase [Actinocrinis sp.]